MENFHAQQPELDATSRAQWRVCVLVPVRNGEAYLDQTLQSLVSQAGPFRLRIHVQDGGSTDGTLAKVDAWVDRVQGGAIACLCEGIEITRSSSADGGMYDAINKAAAAVDVQPADVMCWLNADDYLLPGAIRFVVDRMAQFPDVAWVVSRPCEADAAGVTTRIHDSQVYPKATLAACLHDNRRLRFVMQEGSFWRGWLWQQAGPLRADLRLAGDFDLWRRFAAHAEPHTADIVLGVHRRRPNQLSADLAAYYAEIDERVLTPELRADSEAIWARYSAWYGAEPDADGEGFQGSVIVFDPLQAAWVMESRPLPVPLRPAATLTISGKMAQMLPAHYGSGFSEPQPGSPQWNLPAGARFTSAGPNTLEIRVPARSVYVLQLVCRNFSQDLRISVVRCKSEVLSLAVPATGHTRESVLTGALYLDAGVNHLELIVDGPAGAPNLGLLLQSAGVFPV